MGAWSNFRTGIYTCSSTSTKGLHFAALSFAVFSNDHVLKAFNSCIDKDAGR